MAEPQADRRQAIAVSVADISVPVDGQRHTLRVEAFGYQVWSLGIAGVTQVSQRIIGLVHLCHV